MLLEKRKEIIGDVNTIEDETLKKSRSDASGDLSSMPIHMADVGTDNYDQEFALAAHSRPVVDVFRCLRFYAHCLTLSV